MKNGYKVHWTRHTLTELAQTIRYLENNFSEKEIRKLAQRVESTVELIAHNPQLYPESVQKNIRKAVVLKYNTLYYRVKKNSVEILSFFQTDRIRRKEDFKFAKHL